MQGKKGGKGAARTAKKNANIFCEKRLGIFTNQPKERGKKKKTTTHAAQGSKTHNENILPIWCFV